MGRVSGSTLMTNLEYYQSKAIEMRDLAETARNPDIRKQFMILAAEYDRLGICAVGAPIFSAAESQFNEGVVKLKQAI